MNQELRFFRGLYDCVHATIKHRALCHNAILIPNF